jgi:hypothetical protein
VGVCVEDDDKQGWRRSWIILDQKYSRIVCMY